MPKSSIKPTEPRSSKIKTDKKTAPAKRATPLNLAVSANRAARRKPAVVAKAVRTAVKQVSPAVDSSGSKQAVVLGMLRESTGATVASIMTSTGWQQHSVRGFFAGVVRKRLKLNLTSEPSENGRIYRIADESAVAAAGAATSTPAAA